MLHTTVGGGLGHTRATNFHTQWLTAGGVEVQESTNRGFVHGSQGKAKEPCCAGGFSDSDSAANVTNDDDECGTTTTFFLQVIPSI